MKKYFAHVMSEYYSTKYDQNGKLINNLIENEFLIISEAYI